MEKKISEKLDSIEPNEYAYSFLSSWHLRQLLDLSLLSVRMVECIRALKEYDDFPSESEIYISIEKTLERFKRGLQQEYPNESKGIDFLNKLTERLTNELIEDLGCVPNNVDLQIDAIQKHIDRIKDKIINKLNITNNEGFFEEIAKLTRNSEIHKRQSLFSLAHACSLLGLVGDDYEKMTRDEKLRFLVFEHYIRSKACEALGYWTAKLEMMKQNQKNVKTRTTKKESRKAELKEWMKTMKPKAYRLKAMQSWGVSERTVLNYEQEIRGEKTAILRNKNDTA